MPLARAFLICALFGLLGMGCEHTFSEKSGGAPSSRPSLRPDERIFIRIPIDAIYKKEVIPFSGKKTATSIYAAFGKRTKFAFVAKRSETLAESFESAQGVHANYVIYPTILKWEDHATEWTGVRDKLEVKLDVYDAATQNLLDSVVITGRSRWMNDGGDVPQDLLDSPIENYVNSLYHPKEPPTALPTK